MSWTHERAKVAGLSRDRSPDDPELIAARRNLRAERLSERIASCAAEAAAAAPELTPDQRQRLSALFSEAAGAV